MSDYHTRHPEKEITDESEIMEVLTKERLLTIAMSHEGEPYLVTVNYGFDPQRRAFFFHCATKGRKMDYLTANPTVYCQVIEDKGYVQTECEHHFRTVQFRGRSRVISDLAEMKAAITTLIEHQEDEPGPVLERLLPKVLLEKLSMVEIVAEGYSGKKNGKSGD